MITITRLSGETLAVNSDLIKYAEAKPDTVITLTTGDVIIVRESLKDIIEKVRAAKHTHANPSPS